MHSSSRSISLSSAACRYPQAQSAVITGRRLSAELRCRVFHARRHLLENLPVHDPVLLHLAQLLDQHLLAGFGHAERVLRDVAKQQGWGEDWPEIERQALKNLVPNPVGRLGSVEEVAAAVASSRALSRVTSTAPTCASMGVT